MRGALAGSTGLIGAALAARLAASGHHLVRLGRAASSEGRIDLATDDSIAPRALAGCDALVHAAGVTDEDFADPAAALAKSGRGARVLLAAASHAGVERLAYISSAHIYGPLEGVIDESRAPAPRSDYARAHRATEEAFEAASGTGARALIARPCAVFGMPPSLERFARWSLIPFDFPRQALQGGIVLKSSGLQRRNFVSAEGLAGLVVAWLEAGPAGLTRANAPGPETLSVFDFASLCAKIAAEETGRQCRVERPEPQGTPPGRFEYRTLFGGPLPGPPLQDHVRALLRALRGSPK